MKNVELTLRGPEAYALARRAMDEIEAAGVWPTPLNFEIWLHFLGDPEGALARELTRLLSSGEAFTEQTSELLASEFLPRAKLSEEIRDAGALLNKELSNVAEVIAKAQQSQADYGVTLADASNTLEAAEPVQLKQLVQELETATHKAQRESAQLEQRLEASTQEVSRLKEHLEQVRRDAMTDALTNLANRKAFDEALESACASAEDNRQPLALAVLDIDHFKRFNDTWGHQTGDQVLRYVAGVIARLAKAPRIAARYGGEEFAVVFPGETAATAEAVLNQAREEIASRSLRRRSTNDDLGSVTVSSGVAQRLPGEAAVALLERADAALYASKRAGRNLVTQAPSLNRAA